jgi:DNA-directed RNA polymerase specialized sigma24 family protein
MKAFLNRAFYADKKIAALNMLIAQTRERAQGLSRSSDGNLKGKSDSNNNSTESALLRLAELEQQAQVQRVYAADVLLEIQQKIALLKDDDFETVLTHRFLLYNTIEQTAELMNYAPRTVRQKQKQAIEKLCQLMP